MATIGAAVFPAVCRRMSVLPVLRQSGDVEEHHRLLNPTQNLVHHHPCHRRPRRIPSSEVRLCFAGARSRRLAPISATETNSSFSPFSINLDSIHNKYGIHLHVVGGGDSQEENLGFRRIHIEINPSGPSGETFVIGHIPVHVLHHSVAVLNVIPPGSFPI